jgi:hypothetical protein
MFSNAIHRDAGQLEDKDRNAIVFNEEHGDVGTKL